MSKYRFDELVNIEALEKISTSIYKLTGMPIGVVDLEGHIYVSTGWHDICTKFHRVHPETEHRCRMSERYVESHLLGGDYVEYQCENGMMDMAMPLIIDGDHLATIYLSQFFYEDDVIDRQFFLKQAKEFGFDEVAYMASLDELPRFTPDKVKLILDCYKALMVSLTESGLIRLDNMAANKVVEMHLARFNAIFEAMDDMIFVNDRDLIYRDYISSNAKDLYVPESQFVGKHIDQVLPIEIADSFKRAASQLDEGSEHEEIEYAMTVHHLKHWFSAKITKIMGSSDGGYDYLTVVRDITEIKENEEIIRQMAFYDNLTDIYNRSMFFESLKNTIYKAKRAQATFAVLFIDLDNFKTINDTRGHHIGDLLLKKVAERLSSAIRSGDVIARMGGDEFTMIINSYHNVSEVSLLVKRILELLSQAFEVEDAFVYVTGSVGIAIYPNDGTSFDELIGNADAAMYKAKKLGKNRYKFYNMNINEEIRRKFDLESKLREAVNEEKLYLNYQPIVEVETGEIRGFETLLRWQLADGRQISPMEFIPIAEETGMIVPLGQWVLREACKFNKKLHDDLGVTSIVSVNISIIQLNNIGFLAMLKEILDETGLEASSLELEITESLLIKNFEHVKEILEKIKDLGIKISLDDFGVGYSSLSYVKNLPLDSLKIDRLFIRDVCHDREDEVILEVILSLAHKLNLKVISEGVENLEQVEMLKKRKSDFIQGYYYYKPMSVDKLVDLLSLTIES